MRNHQSRLLIRKQRREIDMLVGELRRICDEDRDIVLSDDVRRYLELDAIRVFDVRGVPGGRADLAGGRPQKDA